MDLDLNELRFWDVLPCISYIDVCRDKVCSILFFSSFGLKMGKCIDFNAFGLKV